MKPIDEAEFEKLCDAINSETTKQVLLLLARKINSLNVLVEDHEDRITEIEEANSDALTEEEEEGDAS